MAPFQIARGMTSHGKRRACCQKGAVVRPSPRPRVGAVRSLRLRRALNFPASVNRRTIMGKYFIAWLLGAPALLLVVVYLLFN